MPIEELEAWVPIIISILTFLLGGGLFTTLVTRRWKKRDVEKEKYGNYLSNFLLPAEQYLAVNQVIFESLRRESGVDFFEFHPTRLKGQFSVMPNGDEMKGYWLGQVDILVHNNREISELFHKEIPTLMSKELRDQIKNFRIHAQSWDKLRESVYDERKEEEFTQKDLDLVGERFPPGFPPALQSEIRRARKEVGRPYDN